MVNEVKCKKAQGKWEVELNTGVACIIAENLIVNTFSLDEK